MRFFKSAFFFLVFLLGACFVLIFSLKKENMQKEKQVEQFSVDALHYNLLKWNIEKHYEYENTPIDDFEITDNEDNTYLFSQLLNKKTSRYKFVFVFSSLNCNSCVDFEISNIKSFSRLIGQDNIIILAQYESIRQLRAFLSTQDLTIPVYYVKNIPANVLEEENLPFSFIINKNLTLEMIFIPIKEIYSHTEMYYKTIYKRFFEDK